MNFRKITKFFKKVSKTVKDDFHAYDVSFQIAFSSFEKNPLHISESDRMNREEKKLIKLEETRNRIEREYSDTLRREGHDEDEIKEQMQIADSFLNTKAKILSFDFLPFEGNDMTKAERDVEFVFNRVGTAGFLYRSFAYIAAIYAIVAFLIKYFNVVLN